MPTRGKVAQIFTIQSGVWFPCIAGVVHHIILCVISLYSRSGEMPTRGKVAQIFTI